MVVDIPDKEAAFVLATNTPLVACRHEVVLDGVPGDAVACTLLLALINQALLNPVRHVRGAHWRVLRYSVSLSVDQKDLTRDCAS